MNELCSAVTSLSQTSGKPKPAPRPKATVRLGGRPRNAVGKSPSPTTAKGNAGSASEDDIDGASNMSKAPVVNSSSSTNGLNHPKSTRTSPAADVRTKQKPMPSPRPKPAEDTKHARKLITGSSSGLAQRQHDITVDEDRSQPCTCSKVLADPAKTQTNGLVNINGSHTINEKSMHKLNHVVIPHAKADSEGASTTGSSPPDHYSGGAFLQTSNKSTGDQTDATSKIKGLVDKNLSEGCSDNEQGRGGRDQSQIEFPVASSVPTRGVLPHWRNGMVTPMKSSTITSHVSYDTPTQSDTDSEDEVAMSNLAGHAYDSLPESETESESEISDDPFATHVKSSHGNEDADSATTKVARDINHKMDTKQRWLNKLNGSSTIASHVSYDTPTQSDTDSESITSLSDSADHAYDSLPLSGTESESEIGNTTLPSTTVINSQEMDYANSRPKVGCLRYADDAANTKQSCSARVGQASHIYAEPVLMKDVHKLFNPDGRVLHLSSPYKTASAPTTPSQSATADIFGLSSLAKRPSNKVARQLLLTTESRSVPEVSTQFLQEDSAEYVQPMISTLSTSASDVTEKSVHYHCTVLPTAEETLAFHKSVSATSLRSQNGMQLQSRTLQQTKQNRQRGRKTLRALGRSMSESELATADDQDYEVMNPARLHPMPVTSRHKSITSLIDNPLYGRPQQELHKLVCQHGNCRCNMPAMQRDNKHSLAEVKEDGFVLPPSSQLSATNDTSDVNREVLKTKEKKKKRKKKKKSGRHMLGMKAKQPPGNPTWYVTL